MVRTRPIPTCLWKNCTVPIQREILTLFSYSNGSAPIHEFTSSSDWFIVLLSSDVIGQILHSINLVPRVSLLPPKKRDPENEVGTQLKTEKFENHLGT